MHLQIRAILQSKWVRRDRPLKLHWLIALSTLPALGVMTAYAIVPHTDAASVDTTMVVQSLPLPASAPAPQSSDTWNQVVVAAGDTLDALLAQLGVRDAAARDFLHQDATCRKLLSPVAGAMLAVRTAPDGRLLALRYARDDRTLTVTRQGAGFSAQETVPPATVRLALRSGTLRGAYFSATDRAGVPEAVAAQLARIFATQIDFHRELHRGDRFSVIFEQTWRNGKVIANGQILAAEFINHGKSYKAVWFQDAAGHGDYYSPDGKSLQRAFLRSPLDFTRITSGFSLRRFDPVLHAWRAHLGVDYAAPIGTPVKATADGTVKVAGRETGYGNVIILRNFGPYSTAYAHLRGFAPGIHAGVHVHQGEVIGYVGMSGWATGPHLHYEFRVNNVQKNPVSTAIPVATPISGQLMAAFHRAEAPMLAKLELLLPTDLARVN